MKRNGKTISGFIVFSCLLAFLLSGCYTPSYYRIHVEDENGSPIPDATLTFVYPLNIDPSGKNSRSHSEMLHTNRNGVANRFGMVKYFGWRVHAYNTQHPDYYPANSVSLSFWNNWIPLRKRGDTDWKISNEIPRYHPIGSNPYDMVRGEFLPPLGNGLHPDVEVVYEGMSSRGVLSDIVFPGGLTFDLNLSPLNQTSSFIGLTQAPDAYPYHSLRECVRAALKAVYSHVEKERDSRSFPNEEAYLSFQMGHDEWWRTFSIYHVVFYFRIRRNGDQALYGKFSSIDRPYELNVSSSRNMELKGNLDLFNLLKDKTLTDQKKFELIQQLIELDCDLAKRSPQGTTFYDEITRANPQFPFHNQLIRLLQQKKGILSTIGIRRKKRLDALSQAIPETGKSVQPVVTEEFIYLPGTVSIYTRPLQTVPLLFENPPTAVDGYLCVYNSRGDIVFFPGQYRSCGEFMQAFLKKNPHLSESLQIRYREYAEQADRELRKK